MRRDYAAEFLRKAEEFELQISMIEHGWKLYPANATEDEQASAIAAYINGGKAAWYPGGYREEPIVIEGKMIPK